MEDISGGIEADLESLRSDSIDQIPSQGEVAPGFKLPVSPVDNTFSAC